MKNNVLYLLLLVCTVAIAQDRKPLKGKVVMGDMPLPGIFVINNKTGDETKTDSWGEFTIKAKRGDGLAVYSEKTDVREFTVTDSNFRNQPVVFSVEFKSYQLNEVVVEDEFKMPKSIPQPEAMTPAEKKAAAEVTLIPKPDPNVQGLAINTDAVINVFTGKRKAMKRALETERKERRIETLRGIYTQDEIVNELNIPAKDIDGYLFYCAGNRKIEKAIKAGDLQLAKEQMARLAVEYAETLKDDK